MPKIEDEIDDLFVKFENDFNESRNKLHEYLVKHKGDKFIGFGAGAKGQFLIHLYGLHNFIDVVIDETPGYPGKFIPGTEVSIFGLSFLSEIDNVSVINLAPTHTKAIMKKVPEEFKFIDPVNGIFAN